MGFFDKVERIKTIASAKVNDIIDKQETPELLMKETIRKMNDQLKKMNQALANSIAVEKDLEIKANDAAAQAIKWTDNAMAAINNGNEELAKQALKNKILSVQHAETLRVMLEDTKMSSANIRMKIASVENEIEEAKIKQSILIAKQKAAEAKMEYVKIAGGDSNTGDELMGRMEERVAADANNANAYDEVVTQTNKNVAESLAMNEKIMEELNKLKSTKNL